MSHDNPPLNKINQNIESGGLSEQTNFKKSIIMYNELSIFSIQISNKFFYLYPSFNKI